MRNPDIDAAYLRAATNRIRLLEAENASFAADVNEAIARIKALEAALREIIINERVPAREQAESSATIARAALAPEQDE